MKPRPNVRYANLTELAAAKRALAMARTAYNAPSMWVILGFLVFSLGVLIGAVLCH